MSGFAESADACDQLTLTIAIRPRRFHFPVACFATIVCFLRQAGEDAAAVNFAYTTAVVWTTLLQITQGVQSWQRRDAVTFAYAMGRLFVDASTDVPQKSIRTRRSAFASCPRSKPVVLWLHPC